MPGADGRGMMGMGMGPPRGPQGMMGTMAYYSPHDPSMMGLMPVRAARCEDRILRVDVPMPTMRTHGLDCH